MNSFQHLICLLFLLVSSDYDVNTWKQIEGTGIYRRDHTLTYIDKDHIYLFGGTDNEGKRTNTLFKLNGETFERLVPGGEAPTPRSRHECCRVMLEDNSIGMMVYGGVDDVGKPLGDAYILKEKGGTYTWEQHMYNLGARYYHSMCEDVANEIAIMFGGVINVNENEEYSSSLFVFETNTQSWKESTPTDKSLLPPRSQNDLTFDEKHTTTEWWFHLSGGRSEKPGDNINIWKLTLEKDGDKWKHTWSIVSYVPKTLPARYSHHCHQIGPSLFLWGGTSGTPTFSIVNTDEQTWSEQTAQSLTIPPVLIYFASCFDDNNNRVIIQGGIDINSGTENPVDSLWIYQCDVCSSHPHCKECFTDHSATCVWCSSKGRCIAATEDKVPLYETCSVAVTEQGKCLQDFVSCRELTTCEQCANAARCGWCQEMSGYPGYVYGCFEGTATAPFLGSCRAWAGQVATCNDVKTELNVYNPTPFMDITYGTKEFLGWYTNGIATESVHYVIYFDLNGENKTLSAKADSDGQILLETPFGTEGLGTITFREWSEQGPGNEILSFTVNVVKPKSKFYYPTKGEKITESHYDISWDVNFMMEYVTLNLLKGDTVIQTLMSSGQNFGSYPWLIDDHVLESGKDYSLQLIWNYGTEIQHKPVIATSEKFELQIQPTTYTITAPKKGDPITPGEFLTIKWTSNRMPSKSVLYLMLGNDKENAEVVQTIAEDLGVDDTEAKWMVNVGRDSDHYFFRIENGLHTIHGDSEFFPIRASRVTVSLTKLDNPSSINFFSGDLVEASWKYVGGKSHFTVWMEGFTGDNIKVSGTLSEDTRNFKFKLPGEIRTGDLYTVHVSAYEFFHGINGSSSPFHVFAPGALPVVSTGGIVFTVIVGVATVAFAFLFYFCWYKRSRLGGFQQI
ncbi:uncharacterized protein MONOS_1279 [Monocercomonoides exilis]|uniref:uncharacterized protein n=1 Tax=Monocercomonoides exilis TaxID=2049356 RepID=UPI00355975B2|nr:hypothetical protein MONOS_1279 [Monocercomonoides exilis]|eukprot:MONOS_1279.1-p1 / transcript=MONOS_1279.1 / gene=MONOS_1279 / organism=Monocercomonoides_exilis_PA203 / gene_product=unspecified product / transcript_product=unspecified product / location=Mono_scaffold00022:28958-32104(-) / protein_length=903 / sequence_SO=supercontig / SO=protein_coding / is_pseudo=false